MAGQTSNDSVAVTERLRRRLCRRGVHPAPIHVGVAPRPARRRITARHAVEDDGWITVLPRPWESQRRERKRSDHG